MRSIIYHYHLHESHNSLSASVSCNTSSQSKAQAANMVLSYMNIQSLDIDSINSFFIGIKDVTAV